MYTTKERMEKKYRQAATQLSKNQIRWKPRMLSVCKGKKDRATTAQPHTPFCKCVNKTHTHTANRNC